MDFRAIFKTITDWIWRFRFGKSLATLAAVVVVCAGGGVCFNIHATQNPETGYADYSYTPGDATFWGCLLAGIFVVGYIATLVVYDRQEQRKYEHKRASIPQQDTFHMVYLPVFEHIFQELDVDNYCYWTQRLAVIGDSIMQTSRYEQLRTLCDYCNHRQVVNGFEEWNSLITNFSQVITDLLDVFDAHSRLEGGNRYRFQHFYNEVKGWNPNEYNRLHTNYVTEVWLIADLTFEMTRLANLILERVREKEQGFCVSAGILSVSDALDREKNNTPIVYGDKEKSVAPYPGLVLFLEARKKRKHGCDTSTDSAWLEQLLRDEYVIN